MSPSTRRSIYIPDHLAQALDIDAADTDDTGTESRSGRIAAILSRYRYLIQTAAVEFTRAEWCLILDAMNGWAAVGVAAEVADHIRLNNATEHWNLSDDAAADLLERLQALTPAETLYFIECAERFWRRAHLDTDDALTQAGCRITKGAMQ